MIEIKKINKSFGDRYIYKDFSLCINDGEFVIIKGKSGSGKTTLLNMIGGIDFPDSGDIYIDELSTKNKSELLKIYREKIGFLFQNFALVDNKTVKENLELIDMSCRSGVSMNESLSLVGLPNAEKRIIYTMSGGEQQRIAIARLFLKKCSIILADEPTGNLDWDNSKIVIDLLLKLNKKGKTILMVTHDERFIKYANKTIEI